MNKDKLEALVKIKLLQTEDANVGEVESLIESGKVRLRDAGNCDLGIESRFDLAYNSVHSIALAALRKNGYRSDKRYLVFQCLEHTVGIQASHWRVLDTAHRKRNNAEYEGVFDVNEELVASIIRVTKEVLNLLEEDKQRDVSWK